MSKKQNPDERIRPDYNALQKVPANVPADDVLVATGKTREDWFAIFDGWGARSLKVGELAEMITAKTTMYSWWAEYLAKAYAKAAAVTKPQTSNTGHQTFSVAKEFAVGPARLYTAYFEPSEWPTDVHPRSLTKREGERIQVGFDDRSRATVLFTEGPNSPGLIQVQHEFIATDEALKAHQAFWKSLLKAIEKRFGA